MFNTILSEWTKQRTTAAFWWTSATTVAIAALYGTLFGWLSSSSGMPYTPMTVVATVAMTIGIVVIVQAAMTVTTEYRFGVQSTNFRLTPKRWQVALAKLLLGVVLAGVVALVAVVAAFILADLTAAVPANWTSNSATQRALWAIPVGMMLITAFSQGIGWILRNTSAVIAVGLSMMLLLETIVGFIPTYGQNIVKFLPFNNVMAFMLNQPTRHWELGTSLGIFALWAAVLWVVGVVLTEKRDA